VLNNVKSKGILGEYQLENLLESMLAPTQFDKQVSVAPGSTKIVDFAVKLPGRAENQNVILPIDSKFPSQYYFELTEAFERGDSAEVESKRKELTKAVKIMAKDISEKYIEPPHTTDFALMFLPLEGLFAEILRDPELFDVLQRNYKVIITGPTTLSALLNSFQMGFRTLALEKKSAQIDKVLQGVKTEFEKFGGVLDKANKNINTAGKHLEDLIGTRTRAIQRKLRDIEVDTEEDSSEYISSGQQINFLDSAE
jgi:DNA recombination protein RmuC